MPGSSSTSKILALSLIAVSFRVVDWGFQWNDERKLAARPWLALDPDLAAHAVDQAARNRQTQAHAFGLFVGGKAEKVVENFQMIFRGDSWASIGDADLDRIGLQQGSSPTLLVDQRITGGAAFPHVGFGVQPHGSARGSELERVFQQIRDDSLHLGGVEREFDDFFIGQ